MSAPSIQAFGLASRDLAEPVTQTMMSGGFPGEPPTNAVTVDWDRPELPVLTDWRDQPISVGTKVIWRQGTTYSGRWAIGRVTAIRKVAYPASPLPVDAWELDIQWDEQSGNLARNESGNARGVKVYNVTVWPGDQLAAVTAQRDELAACLPIEELELERRAYNVLKAAGIRHVGELLRMSNGDVMDLRNAGGKTLENITDRLRDVCGLTLKQGDEW